MIHVITLGDDVGNLTLAAAEQLRSGDTVLLKTGRHPIAKWLRQQKIEAVALDALYEQADDFDALNRLLASAVSENAPCVYAVMDATCDESVRLLLQARDDVCILPGINQASQLLAAAREVQPAQGTAMITAVSIASLRFNPLQALVILELDTAVLASEVKLHLLKIYAPEAWIWLKNQSGCQRIPLEALDRQNHYDHTTCVYVPASPLEKRARHTFEDLVDIMAQLRAPGGCPWDQEQTHRSLREYLLEEACEALEAIDLEDMDKLADELGDVLLQVVFHACVDQQHGGFDILDVCSAICNKMIQRHAHIFGDVVCETSDDVLKSWEAIKKKEKGLQTQADAMRDIPRQLPALMRAGKVQKKARNVGFDWETALDAFPKIQEETQEVLLALQTQQGLEEELGDLLFAVVNVARLSGIQPELALSASTDKFMRRFEQMERAIVADGLNLNDMTLNEMDVYWEMVKGREVR